MAETEPLVSPENPNGAFSYAEYKKKYASRKTLKAFLAVLLAGVLLFTNAVPLAQLLLELTSHPELCPLYETLAPPSFHKDNSTVLQILHDAKFRKASAQKLSSAVQVDTTVYDNPPDVSENPLYWAHIVNFHQYLEKTFPTVHQHLEVTKVNTYGLVYEWKGSNPALKPLLLTAHQDVVPVQEDTFGDWTYPPFSGHYDGEYVYGRGASDCKNLLVAVLELIELLLAQDYKPQRTVLAVFGFDEEASGRHGAAHLGKYLLEKHGKDSIYAIVDEGLGVMPDELTKQIVGVVGVGEKGYLDIQVAITTPGGHSSVPPDHTSVGMAGDLAVLIEGDQFEPVLGPQNPVLLYLQCMAVNSGNKIPSLTRKAILRAGFDKFANSQVLKLVRSNPLVRYLVQTSQAIDLIRGGEKVNALPEEVKVMVNHRILVESSLSHVRSRFTQRVLALAQKHSLRAESFGETIYEPKESKGRVVVSDYSAGLDPAPVSPSDDTIWKYIAGTTRHVFEDLVFGNLTYPVITAPAIMPANTDTRYYWGLTKNIYRYTPYVVGNPMKENHIHSVDERVRMDGHLQLVAFYYEYIQNVDTPDADN